MKVAEYWTIDEVTSHDQVYWERRVGEFMEWHQCRPYTRAVYCVLEDETGHYRLTPFTGEAGGSDAYLLANRDTRKLFFYFGPLVSSEDRCRMRAALEDDYNAEILLPGIRLTAPSNQQTTSTQELLASRGKQYGEFSDVARIVQALKHQAREHVKRKGEDWEDKFTTVQSEALDMIFHKIGRILNGNPNYKDSWDDIAGYATLASKELEDGKS